ncbi:MAG: hypothetical protein LUE08_05725, partial [Akkermansiaceae bacterium]|nr:hypothetical protein [Akkermansiaceae bacterium]
LRALRTLRAALAKLRSLRRGSSAITLRAALAVLTKLRALRTLRAALAKLRSLRRGSSAITLRAALAVLTKLRALRTLRAALAKLRSLRRGSLVTWLGRTLSADNSRKGESHSGKNGFNHNIYCFEFWIS